jgi:glycerophosphoryl diester phosphodiesterase
MSRHKGGDYPRIFDVYWVVGFRRTRVARELSPFRVGGIPPVAVLNIAPRGARAFAPENTLPAFEKAKRMGCSMIELDVHMSKDGVPVVHHDDQLVRCTNVQRKFPGRSSYFVSDLTCDELHTLDAGSWFVEQLALPAGERQPFLHRLKDAEREQFVSPHELKLYASGEVRLPTLEQVLELARDIDILVNIELKALPRMYPHLTDAVVKLVEAKSLERSVLISSFDHEQLVAVRRLSNVIPTGVLTCERLAQPGEYMRLLDADFYHPGCYGDVDSMGFGSVNGKLDPRSIINSLAFGYGVIVWTCNDMDQMRQLIAAGVTGLISDFPNRLRDVLSE